MMHVMILQHEDGHERYFGPLKNLELATKTAEAYFGCENTPYTVSFVPLIEPLGTEFLEAKRKDEET